MLSTRGTDVAPRSRIRRALLLGSYGAALVLSGWAYWYRLDRYPSYMDYDSSTLGIFVNNLTYHGRVDYFFDRYADEKDPELAEQDRYRVFWGAQFLPAAVVLSGLQRTVGLRPDQVGLLLTAVTMALGFLGCLFAAAVAARGSRFGRVDALFLVGFAASLPPFPLYLRTEVPHFFYSFCMFWLATCLIVRFVETTAPRWIYALAVVVALYALLPYPPIVWLPLVGLWLGARRGLVGRVIRSRAPYAAVAIGAALFFALQYSVATTWEGSYPQWCDKVARFLAIRSKAAVSLDGLRPSALATKATQLVHQQFWFQHDALGDQTRSDYLWTLPQPHAVWLLLIPVAVFGLWRGLRDRDAAASVFASVLAVGVLVSLTVGAPEGRYLLPLVPCYAYFVWLGVRSLVRSDELRIAVLGLVLVATAANSLVLVRGDYDLVMKYVWNASAGLRETMALIREHDPDSARDGAALYLSWPHVTLPSRLYLEMLGNGDVRLFGPSDVAGDVGRGRRLYAAADSVSPGAAEAWEKLGFERIGEVVDEASDRHVTVLTKPAGTSAP